MSIRKRKFIIKLNKDEKRIKYLYRGIELYRIYIIVSCSVCGKRILREKSRFKQKVKNKKSNFSCSKKCKKILMSGSNNANWTGGVKYKSSGYKLIYKPEHPYAYKNYVPEHRLIMEKYLCRYLKKDEYIHHINCIKNDNRLENLYLCTKFQHNAAHGSLEKNTKELIDKGYLGFNKKKGEYTVL